MTLIDTKRIRIFKKGNTWLAAYPVPVRQNTGIYTRMTSHFPTWDRAMEAAEVISRALQKETVG